MPDKEPVRIGIFGAARIVKDSLLAPALQVGGVHVAAIAARDPHRAQAYADKQGIPRVHSSYEAMLADPDIDAVCVALPAALHAEWTIASVQAGKHVLCEKPFTSNTAAAQRVESVAASSDRVVMEAYHTHYHPLHSRLREILASGEIGKVRSAWATFCIPVPPGRDIRWNLALGGGSLLNLGYYPVRTLTGLFGPTPHVKDSRAWTREDVDRRIESTLQFDNGVTRKIMSSLWSRQLLSMQLSIQGEARQMQVTRPYQPQMGSRIKVKGIGGHRTERTHPQIHIHLPDRSLPGLHPTKNRGCDGLRSSGPTAPDTRRNPRCGRAGTTPLIRIHTALAGHPINECNNKPELRNRS